MPYTPVNFQDGVTPLNAATMNKLDDALEDLYTNPAAALTYEGDHVPATSYQDGDIVVKDGIAYLCVGGPTTAAPNPVPWGAAALSAPSYGTSLPASPANGQEAILVDSVTNPTYQWRFRYNAGHTGDAYKWEFVGGTDAHTGAADTIVPAAGWNLLAMGAPRPGLYDVAGAFECWHPSVANVSGNFRAVPATGTLGNLFGQMFMVVAGIGHSSGPYRDVITVAPASNIFLQLNAISQSTINVRSRWMTMRPIRVS